MKHIVIRTLLAVILLLSIPIIGWSIDFIKSDGPALVWALAVPCYIKHTCSEGEK
jgi:hypothetical protein